MKKYSGFTLLELIVTVVIVALVAAIAVPAMQTFAQNDRLISQINTLTGHLAYARSEAVKRAQQVAICVSNNTTTCTGGANWEDGWIVYVDANADGTFNPGGLNEDLLRAQQTLEGGNTLSTTIGTQVTYDYRGYVTAASIGSFSLCDSRGATYGRAIAISTTGRVRREDTVSC